MKREQLRKALYELKKSKGLSYKQIAAGAGVSYTGAWHFMNNATDSDERIVIALLEFLEGKHYHGRECTRCSGTLRYKRSDDCVTCQRHYQKVSQSRSVERKSSNRLLTLAHDMPPSKKASLPIMTMAWR